MRVTPSRGWTPPRVGPLILMYAFIQISNVFDALATLRLAGRPGYEEANPWFRILLAAGPRDFLKWKLVSMIVTVAAAAWFARRYRPVWWAFCAVFATYACVDAYYVYILFFFTPPP